MSVGPTSAGLRNDRRRLEFLFWSKWRRPAPRRRTFPPAVILKRLATDFLVLMPLGRRILVHFLWQGTTWSRARYGSKCGLFHLAFNIGPWLYPRQYFENAVAI